MAISFVGFNAAVASSVSLPTFTAGDIALVYAYRDGSNTSPTLPFGYTNIVASGAFQNSQRVGYRVLQSGDTTTGTWTNATEIQVLVLRGQRTTNPIGSSGATNGTNNSNAIAYLEFPLDDTSGSSWVVGFAGHRTATDVFSRTATGGMTTRSGSSSATSLATHTLPTGTFSAQGYTVNATAAWVSYAFEVRSQAGATQTGTAQISLASGQTPSARTDHKIAVRARVASGSGTLKARLYEGGVARSAELETSALTSSLATYTLSISDADAATIGSYGNLELRLWGYSASGGASVFEVASAELQLPSPSSGTKFGAVVSPLTLNVATSGFVTSSGAKSTGVAHISLAAGLEPATRTGHQISVRARTTSAAGTLRVQLFEGTTARSAELETGALTTSLANYTLNIADADAATIGSYSNLELRIRGYSATGAATVFEVAEASLVLPGSTTGGSLTGEAVLSALAAITVGGGSAGGPIYPGAGVFPQNLASVRATGTITAAIGGIDRFGAVSLPLTLGRVTTGFVPPNKVGTALLASTATIVVAGAVDRRGAAVLSSSATITVGGGQDVTGAVAISATSTITAAGAVLGPPSPPGYVNVAGLASLPDTLVAVAFTSSPQETIQSYTAITPYLRGINAKRGRQFELDRIEAGTSSFVASNRDGRFNPENTASPYYPNLKPTKRMRWSAVWSSVEYELFQGFLEGYPLAFPDKGFDRIVTQNAVDLFMALAVTKFIPSTAVLTSNLAALTADGAEWIGIDSTALPMPQAVPFSITIDEETMTVTELSPASYRVERTASGSAAHAVGATVTTPTVSFGQEYTGQRIQHVLDYINLPLASDIDAGQSLLAPSEDLAGAAPIEHLMLVAEVENGRFFAARDGTLTFHGRHRFYADEKTSRATFGDNGTTELPYTDVSPTWDETKLYNIVRITPASGETFEARDQASIDDHFERVLEKQWPLADANEAKDAAEYLLSRLSRMQLRIPELSLAGRSEPSLMWPHVLGLEIGQRFDFKNRPKDGSQTIEKTLVVEGVEHAMSEDDLRTKVQLSLADTTHYWQLEVAGYSELNDTTRLTY